VTQCANIDNPDGKSAELVSREQHLNDIFRVVLVVTDISK